eukprot:5810942-Prorocentrum_lima.AAC.2
MQHEKLKQHGVRLGMGLWGATQCWEWNERSAIVVGSRTQVGAWKWRDSPKWGAGPPGHSATQIWR